MSPKPEDDAANNSAKTKTKSLVATAKCEVLANGARLIMQPDSRLPNLHLRLLSLGGSAFESTTQRGATNLMATLLARDTAKRSAAKVASDIETVGGSLSPVTGNKPLGWRWKCSPATSISRWIYSAKRP